MKQQKRIVYFLSLFLMMFVFNNNVLQADTFEVSNFRSLSHGINEPSQVTKISMTWDQPTGYSSISGYAYTINTSESFTYTYTNKPENLLDREWDISQSFEGSDDTYYYVHIAPVSEFDPGKYPDPFHIIGSTTTFGPVRIDTEAPTGPSVSSDYTRTDQSTIELTLYAEDAVGTPKWMCISNSGYGNCTQELFSESKTWPLDGEMNSETPKSVYVQFIDTAGNSVNAPILNVYYMDLSPEETQIPTLSEWGMIILSGILMMSAMVIMRRRQNHLG